MNVKDLILAVIMVFSASMLVYRWISMYGKSDLTLVALTTLFVSTLAIFLISIGLRMSRVLEESQSIKRVIAVNSDELQNNLESRLKSALRHIEMRIESIEKRLYR